jgi:hypothetical protein
MEMGVSLRFKKKDYSRTWMITQINFVVGPSIQFRWGNMEDWENYEIGSLDWQTSKLQTSVEFPAGTSFISK